MSKTYSVIYLEDGVQIQDEDENQFFYPEEIVNDVPLEQILEWFESDLSYINEHEVESAYIMHELMFNN